MNSKCLVEDKAQCSGCTACYNVCPTKAICMKMDEKGFLYPKIDENLCINCRLCVNVCDFRTRTNIKKKYSIYACKNKDENEVSSSRSGAVFPAICKYVINNNGIVFGCTKNRENNVYHIQIDKYEDVIKLKGSKYVQSDIKNTFTECMNYLQSDRLCLFSGTPCQIHGLLKFLKVKKVNIDKLITCDIVCHGVPSEKVWKEYICELEKKYDSRIIESNFRNKNKFGWKSHIESFTLENGVTIYSKKFSDLYYSHCILRESCFNCKYTTLYRDSDFTIGDCWGVEKVSNSFDDDKGTSLLLINTKKGYIIFNQIKDLLNFIEIDDISKVNQNNLLKPTKKPIYYDEFWNFFIKKMGNRNFYVSKIVDFEWKIIKKTTVLIKRFYE